MNAFLIFLSCGSACNFLVIKALIKMHPNTHTIRIIRKYFSFFLAAKKSNCTIVHYHSLFLPSFFNRIVLFEGRRLYSADISQFNPNLSIITGYLRLSLSIYQGLSTDQNLL